jgi:hypothetical protein
LKEFDQLEKDGQSDFDLMIKIEKMSDFVSQWESLDTSPNIGKYPFETK